MLLDSVNVYSTLSMAVQ